MIHPGLTLEVIMTALAKSRYCLLSNTGASRYDSERGRI